ncbi:MAG: sigma-70 family RNA polymerase sigma factor [Planctomycetaceae bacterium]
MQPLSVQAAWKLINDVIAPEQAKMCRWLVQTGKLCDFDAEAVCSDLRLRLFQYLINPTDGIAVRELSVPFAWSALKNVLTDEIRRRRRRHCGQLAKDQPLPEETCTTFDQPERVAVALQQLKPEDSRLIHLLYFDGYSQREVAERLGRSPGTISRRVKHVLRSLRHSYFMTGSPNA